MNEKKKIIYHRVIWLAIFLLCLSIFMIGLKPDYEDIKVVNKNCIPTYDSQTNKTKCEVLLTFNTELSDGSIIINFCDSTDNVLSTATLKIESGTKVISETFLSVSGKVSHINVEKINASKVKKAPAYLVLAILLIPISFVMFIASLLLSYREYKYNDGVLSVYAGMFHHTLRFNDTLLDEHNTFISYTPINLSYTTDSGDKITVVISLTNRISLKINDQLK